ncbi:hypothetical protein STBA_69640 [Streptomyces sp. MP131-18]|nr:hypothetical protein STBA_69640 [Streptomyces sp. MP131-18]
MGAKRNWPADYRGDRPGDGRGAAERARGHAAGPTAAVPRVPRGGGRVSEPRNAASCGAVRPSSHRAEPAMKRRKDLV